MVALKRESHSFDVKVRMSQDDHSLIAEEQEV